MAKVTDSKKSVNSIATSYSKACLKRLLKKKTKNCFSKTDFRLMQVKSIAGALLSTFIKLPFVFETYVLSIFEWPLKTGLTVASRKTKTPYQC